MVAPMSRFPPTSVTGRPPPLSCHASSSPSCHATSQPPNLGSDPSLSLPWRALARSDSLPRCTAVDVAAHLSLRQSPPHASPSDASPSPSPALSPARPGSHALPSRRDVSSRESRCTAIALRSAWLLLDHHPRPPRPPGGGIRHTAEGCSWDAGGALLESALLRRVLRYNCAALVLV